MTYSSVTGTRTVSLRSTPQGTHIGFAVAFTETTPGHQPTIAVWCAPKVNFLHRTNTADIRRKARLGSATAAVTTVIDRDPKEIAAINLCRILVDGFST